VLGAISVLGAIGAIGALSVRIPEAVVLHTSESERTVFRACFLVYALAGLVVLIRYRSFDVSVRDTTDPPVPLGESKRIVHRLAALFSLDAFGGESVVQSLLALWLFQKFRMSVSAAGSLLFLTGTLSAASGFVASWLAARIGLIRTMVFTHLPANMLLITTAFMPVLPLALMCLNPAQPVVVDGRAGPHLLREGGGVTRRTPGGGVCDQRAA
jgi:predicted MFS family arabinose efflux permease